MAARRRRARVRVGRDALAICGLIRPRRGVVELDGARTPESRRRAETLERVYGMFPRLAERHAQLAGTAR
jgi:hypothetical protein